MTFKMDLAGWVQFQQAQTGQQSEERHNGPIQRLFWGPDQSRMAGVEIGEWLVMIDRWLRGNGERVEPRYPGICQCPRLPS